jgi:hypothetical protein
MSVEPTDQRSPVVTRERLAVTLAAPFVLLLASSLLSWPWRSLGLPGTVGTSTPPSIILLVFTVVGATIALRRGLPLGMITWLPAGQGAILLLTTGFVADTATPAAIVAIITANIVVYLMALGLAIAISTHGTALGVTYITLFVLTQTARFPLFGADSSVDIDAAGLLTLASAMRATAEIAMVVWLTRRLVEGPDDEAPRGAALLVALAVFHGIIASWEDPVLRGDFGLVQTFENATLWFVLVALQISIAFALIRLRRSLSSEPRWADPVPAPGTPEPGQPAADAPEATVTETEPTPSPPRRATPMRRDRRPSPRRHRRQ